MNSLPTLPTELVCRVLGFLDPITALHEYDISEEQRWDVRHWNRSLAAISRTCRSLHTIATPLLYSRYEAAFHNPVIPFIERSTVKHPRHQGVKHIAIRTDGSTNDEYAPTPERLSQYHIWARGSELDSFVLSETQLLTSEDAGVIELWRLLSQAPNLQSLSVTAYRRRKKDDGNPDEPPVWMLPIILAAQSQLTAPRYSGWFRKLHTLRFDLDGQCGTWLIQLLALPCLDSLSVGSWGIEPYADWEASLVWPEPIATSSVHYLSFWNVSVPADVIVRIMDHCKALKSFSCRRAWDIYHGAAMRRKQWCVDILAGLQRHRETITSLVLDPGNGLNALHLGSETARIDSFQTMTALASLDVPWHVIMGSPAGIKNSQGSWKSVGDWRYPALRDILPKNLRHLKIVSAQYGTPDCTGVEEALYSAIPASDAESDVFLSDGVELVNHCLRYDEPLPMNYWRIKNTFQKADYQFEYRLGLRSDDFSKPAQCSVLYLLILE